MTDVVILAAIACIAPTLTSLAGVVVSVMSAKRSMRQNDTILEKTDVIHGLVNSEMAKVRAELVAALEKISGLQEMVGQLQQTHERDKSRERKQRKGDREVL